MDKRRRERTAALRRDSVCRTAQRPEHVPFWGSKTLTEETPADLLTVRIISEFFDFVVTKTTSAHAPLAAIFPFLKL